MIHQFTNLRSQHCNFEKEWKLVITEANWGVLGN